jgi:hypothetical protein
VAVSVRLDAYLDLERTMRALDDVGDPIADTLRDALDPIWYALADDERAFLNRRVVVSGPVYAVRLAPDANLFVAVPAPSLSTTVPTPPIPIVDWKYAA